MKKVLFTILCFSLYTTIATGQVKFGLGATYLNNIGIQARADLPLVDGFDIEPKFSYYLVDNSTNISLDIDATYNLIHFGDSNPLYALLGPALYRSSSDGFSNTDLGLNLGAGLGIQHIYFEIKYTTLFCETCDGQLGGNLVYMF